MDPHILIMAAGQGKRMYSDLPKVLHPVLYRPMLHYVLDVANAIPRKSVSVIVGHGEAAVREACAGFEGLKYFSQPEQKGTADAVRRAESFLKTAEGDLLVLSGDVMLLQSATLEELVNLHRTSGALATVLTAEVSDPKGYGRIVRAADGHIERIREQADCSPEEAKISEVNSGIYVFKIAPLLETLGKIGDRNKQHEFYLTDVIELLGAKGKIAGSRLKDPAEMTGINDRAALARVEGILQERINTAWMFRGVTLQSPASIFIDPLSKIGKDARIEAGSIIVRSQIGEGATVEAGSRVFDTGVGKGAVIKQGSYVHESEIGEGAGVGPYAHLRPGTRLGKNVKIGNFVEVKKSSFGEGSKASHLSYIGDAEVGKNVNLGCGFITCNYDGVNKHKTVIGDDVFVGSDSQLVAPVTIQTGSYVAAGSTITRDVPRDALALSRGKQVNKDGYAKRFRGKSKT